MICRLNNIYFFIKFPRLEEFQHENFTDILFVGVWITITFVCSNKAWVYFIARFIVINTV